MAEQPDATTVHRLIEAQAARSPAPLWAASLPNRCSLSSEQASRKFLACRKAPPSDWSS